jgi:hypothetical protein
MHCGDGCGDDASPSRRRHEPRSLTSHHQHTQRNVITIAAIACKENAMDIGFVVVHETIGLYTENAVF